MITEAEVLRRARDWRVDPMIVDLDYVLGCFLSQWFRLPAAKEMLFKGGTCLRKCYLADYRFSEDVDITARSQLGEGDVQEAVDIVARELANSVGVDLLAQPSRIETIKEGPSSWSVEARLYFRGPLQRTGSPRGLRIDLSSGEVLVFPTVAKKLSHPYSDLDIIGVPEIELPCYDLREMLLEKLRGISGQRRFAIARDLYDIQQLLERMDVRVEDVLPHARVKFAAKDIDLSSKTLDGLQARKDEFEADWARNVERLIPAGEAADFGSAWAAAIHAVSALVNREEG